MVDGKMNGERGREVFGEGRKLRLREVLAADS